MGICECILGDSVLLHMCLLCREMVTLNIWHSSLWASINFACPLYLICLPYLQDPCSGHKWVQGLRPFFYLVCDWIRSVTHFRPVTMNFPVHSLPWCLCPREVALHQLPAERNGGRQYLHVMGHLQLTKSQTYCSRQSLDEIWHVNPVLTGWVLANPFSQSEIWNRKETISKLAAGTKI